MAVEGGCEKMRHPVYILTRLDERITMVPFLALPSQVNQEKVKGPEKSVGYTEKSVGYQ